MSLDITFFVPCYNEEKLIAATLQTILEAVSRFPYSFEILIVDDASKDNSVAVIRKFIEENRPRTKGEIILIQNRNNQGVGANYIRAAEMAKGKYFMGVCGDHAEPLSALVAMLHLLGKAEIVIAYFNTRLFSKKYCLDKRPFSRRLLSILFNRFFVRLASGHRLHYYNGPVLHRTENILAYSVPASGLGFQCEMVCNMLNDKKSYLEVMVANNDRMEGTTSAFRWKNIRSVGGSLCRILANRFRSP